LPPTAPAAADETDEAVAAFFAEDQGEAEAAVDESDIEDLFDSLETDFSTEQPETTASVALEEEVALFFEEATETADTDPPAEVEIGETVTAGVVAAALAGTAVAVACRTGKRRWFSNSLRKIPTRGRRYWLQKIPATWLLPSPRKLAKKR
jgi:hypothetical protein